MTVRELYENVLIEINKIGAPSFLIDDFVYFANKSVQQYINLVYNRYEVNQQSTDDLSALKRSVKLEEVSGKSSNNYYNLPDDYLHLLNCVVSFDRSGLGFKCYSNEEPYKSLARRLTSDNAPLIETNAYFKPSFKTPYFSIITADVQPSEEEKAIDKMMSPCDNSQVEYKSKLVLEIKSGKYKPTEVKIDYIKTPKAITLEYEDLEDEDTTEELEFPQYVCYEIVNNLVKLVLENQSNPRIQTNMPINQTIAGTMAND